MPLKRQPATTVGFQNVARSALFVLDKERPAVVISSSAQNRHSLDVCVAPLSSGEPKAFSLRPNLRAGEGGLDRGSPGSNAIG